MKICVLGSGYVGLVTAVCLAKLGHTVVGLDIDAEKINKLQQGILPIYEPGLEELLTTYLQVGNLSFTQDLATALKDSQVVFNAVGTPPDDNRRADLTYVEAAARQVAEHLDHYLVFVNKSTVPVGTAERVRQIIQENLRVKTDFAVASNPEFLREGSAIGDFLQPDRIVVGVDSEMAADYLRQVYQPLISEGKTFMLTDIKSAELIKYAANSFLATKVGFINEVANVCDSLGADISQVARGIGLDTRINPKFLEAGPGFGGSCFPKDVDEFIYTASDAGVALQILPAVVLANKQQRLVVINKLSKHLGNLSGKTIALWGLAFKPKTDDVRESAALDIIKQLYAAGANIQAYDPLANKNAQVVLDKLNNIKFFNDKFLALKEADALLLMTHWEEFGAVKAAEIAPHLKIIVDARNLWSRSDFESLGLIYEGIGR